MKQSLLLLPVVLWLTSCAIDGAAVGWGGSHKPVLLNELSATYLYDPLVGGYGRVMEDASKHCAGYGKSAVPTESANQGVLKTQTFECR